MISAIAIIPARGGSKGIPNKNIVELAGKPLIAHSIEDSLNCSKVQRTIVSTDDPEIAEVARQYGAEVPFIRPAIIAEDDTPDLPVFAHALEWLQDQENSLPELVVHLRPTTPLRPPGLVEKGIQMLMEDPLADCVRSVCEPPHTPYKMWQIEGNYIKPFLKLRNKESFNLPRQNLPQVFCHDGLLDVIRTSTILDKNTMTGKHILPLRTEDSFFVVDIDKPVDLVLAEVFIRHNNKIKNLKDSDPKKINNG
jgi:CMP-N,N'-diacetyllegionaminic acid synthase